AELLDHTVALVVQVLVGAEFVQQVPHFDTPDLVEIAFVLLVLPENRVDLCETTVNFAVGTGGLEAVEILYGIPANCSGNYGKQHRERDEPNVENAALLDRTRLVRPALRDPQAAELDPEQQDAPEDRGFLPQIFRMVLRIAS